MINRFLSRGVVIICTAALIGCNTIHGFGKDIESIGQALKKSSE